ncbi:MAG: hypothetical protein QMD06_01230 [Candidatus Altarchaeum sp.]|nr:hypothetical protein [Candidatus Altarchaeum sp.]
MEGEGYKVLDLRELAGILKIPLDPNKEIIMKEIISSLNSVHP